MKKISGVFCHVFLRSACHLSPIQLKICPPPPPQKRTLNCIGIRKQNFKENDTENAQHITSVENKSGKTWLDSIICGIRNCRKTIICHIT